MKDFNAVILYLFFIQDLSTVNKYLTLADTMLDNIASLAEGFYDEASVSKKMVKMVFQQQIN